MVGENWRQRKPLELALPRRPLATSVFLALITHKLQLSFCLNPIRALVIAGFTPKTPVLFSLKYAISMVITAVMDSDTGDELFWRCNTPRDSRHLGSLRLHPVPVGIGGDSPETVPPHQFHGLLDLE